MLIPVITLKEQFGVLPKSILHVGAHEAEELSEYQEHWTEQNQPIYWVEGQPKLVEKLIEKLDKDKNVVISAYVWNIDGEVKNFMVSTNSQSSSLLTFGTHETKLPEIKIDRIEQVITSRLDSLLERNLVFEFINLDLQGVELQALEGLGTFLNKAKWIYTEVNKEEVYENCTKVQDLDRYLKSFGFRRIITLWCPGLGWGDALYVKKPNIKIFKALLKFRLNQMILACKVFVIERTKK
jgi:FkbM family methyltransferase